MMTTLQDLMFKNEVDGPIVIHRATLGTRNFSFEAYGASEDQARALLVAGLVNHAIQWRIRDDWWHDDVDDIEVRMVQIGAAYRDREELK